MTDKAIGGAMKPTRAWAVVDEEIEAGFEIPEWPRIDAKEPINLFPTETLAEHNRWNFERVVEVLITPIDDQAKADELRGKR